MTGIASSDEIVPGLSTQLHVLCMHGSRNYMVALNGSPPQRSSGGAHVARKRLCGGIKYRINGRLSGAMNCHCSMCRKAQGSAFRSRAAVKSAEFEFVQGEELVTFYESSPGNHRGFCRVCGSPILSKFDNRPDHYGLPMGALDDDPGLQPKLHVHVSSKAPWFAITDDLPQFPGAPQ